MLSSRRPAWPTKGSPCASSSAPGASPTNSHRAWGSPTPGTVLRRVWQSAQAVQPSMSATQRVTIERGDRALPRIGGSAIAAVGRRPRCGRRGRTRRVPDSASQPPLRRADRARAGRRRASPSTGGRTLRQRRADSASPAHPRARRRRRRRVVARAAGDRRESCRARTARSRAGCRPCTSRKNCSADKPPRVVDELREQLATEPLAARLRHHRQVEELRLARTQHQHAVGDDAAVDARRPASSSRRPAHRENCLRSRARRGSAPRALRSPTGRPAASDATRRSRCLRSPRDPASAASPSRSPGYSLQARRRARRWSARRDWRT